MNAWILLPVLLPALSGICLLCSSFKSHLRSSGKDIWHDLDEQERRKLHCFVGAVLMLTAVLALLAAWSGEHEVRLFELMEGIPVYFRIDAVGRLFVTFVTIVVGIGRLLFFCVYEARGRRAAVFRIFSAGLRCVGCAGFRWKYRDDVPVL